MSHVNLSFQKPFCGPVAFEVCKPTGTIDKIFDHMAALGKRLLPPAGLNYTNVINGVPIDDGCDLLAQLLGFVDRIGDCSLAQLVANNDTV